jgi:hypothetical protein
MTEEKPIAVLVSNPGPIQAHVREALAANYDVRMISYDRKCRKQSLLGSRVAEDIMRNANGKKVEVLIFETSSPVADDFDRNYTVAAHEAVKLLSQGATQIPTVLVADQPALEGHLKQFNKGRAHAEGIVRLAIAGSLLEAVEKARVHPHVSLERNGQPTRPWAGYGFADGPRRF